MNLVARKSCYQGFQSSKTNQPAQLQRLAGILKFACNKSSYYTFQDANNKGTDQYDGIHRLVCTFVVNDTCRQIEFSYNRVDI